MNGREKIILNILIMLLILCSYSVMAFEQLVPLGEVDQIVLHSIVLPR
ncbi:hypothetical protein TKV_c08150 [Thermoanaerobacter kivui]|uniref:Uncharacterized protein n=1 Tax=Thermoanaerobacter kivui TaxID=2325 RepID=A0A097AQD2_THEKI|nr:hypothetical protein TKV_c08150 [Thermoanaerobacter kivui]